MALSQIIDLTSTFSATGAKVDISGWDVCVVQLVTPGGTVTFNTSNDAGAVEGETDGDASTSTNYTVCSGINLATGAAATTLAITGLIKFTNIGRFLQLAATDLTPEKVILYLSKWK
jgi:hypothetical protein